MPGGTEWWWYHLRRLWRRGLDDQAGRPARCRQRRNQIDLVDYEDIRVALGIDFRRPAGSTGFFEGGDAVTAN